MASRVVEYAPYFPFYDFSGVPGDLENYVSLMSDLRTAFSSSTAKYGENIERSKFCY